MAYESFQQIQYSNNSGRTTMLNNCRQCSKNLNLNARSGEQNICQDCEKDHGNIFKAPFKISRRNKGFPQKSKTAKEHINELMKNSDQPEYSASNTTAEEKRYNFEELVNMEISERKPSQTTYCHQCGSIKIIQIADDRNVKVYPFGIFGIVCIGNSWRCNHCGNEF